MFTHTKFTCFEIDRDIIVIYYEMHYQKLTTFITKIFIPNFPITSTYTAVHCCKAITVIYIVEPVFENLNIYIYTVATLVFPRKRILKVFEYYNFVLDLRIKSSSRDIISSTSRLLSLRTD